MRERSGIIDHKISMNVTDVNTGVWQHWRSTRWAQLLRFAD